jgi:REP element-mobilizing transposase RayT
MCCYDPFFNLRLSSESGYAAGMKPAPLTPQTKWHHLPRLAPELYRGFAVVQWTVTLERRATGWLDERFHLHFRELLLHAAAREGLFCPVYVLMPDHLHLLWMGLRVDSDQRNAMKFLRKHLAVELARRSPTGVEFELQKQSHDSVLREKDRMRGAFEKSCFYLLDNPCRRKLADHPRDWPHLGAVVPGYPFLHPLGEDFWESFWKLYLQEREAMPLT